MNQQAWEAVFAGREQAWRAERAAYHAEVGARIMAERAPTIPAPIVVLEPAHELDPAGLSGRRPGWAVVLGLAHSLGWAARALRSLAADPARGLVETITVRFRRHDERGFVGWERRAGPLGFQGGWYVGPGGLERLAGTRMTSRKAPEDGSVMIRGVQDVLEGLRLPVS